MLPFYYNDTATTVIYTLSLHDALPIFTVSHFLPCAAAPSATREVIAAAKRSLSGFMAGPCSGGPAGPRPELTRKRSEEHTSELQSLAYLVCRLLLEKKKII